MDISEVIQYDVISGGARSGFSKAAFITDDTDEIDVTDPDFWRYIY